MQQKKFKFKDFSDRLSSELKSAALKQATIAERLNVSEGSVSGWVKGSSKPHRKTVIALAEVLGVRPEWLINGEGPRLPPGKAEAEVHDLPIQGANPADQRDRAPPDPAKETSTIPAELRKVADSLRRIADLMEKDQ